MISVAILAVLFALPAVLAVILIALYIPVAAVIGARWLVLKRMRGVAARVFWGLAVSINVAYAAACVAPDLYFLAPFYFGSVIVVPTIAAFGVAWANLATREDATPRRFESTVKVPVAFFSALPILTLSTYWPLHLAFLASRPALEQLADRVAAGRVTGLPRRAGVFWVAGFRIDNATGNVGLITDPNPTGPNGFVRVRPGASAEDPLRTIVGSNLNVDLGGGWSYRDAD
jgi:hypothetical protein